MPEQIVERALRFAGVEEYAGTRATDVRVVVTPTRSLVRADDLSLRLRARIVQDFVELPGEVLLPVTDQQGWRTVDGLDLVLDETEQSHLYVVQVGRWRSGRLTVFVEGLVALPAGEGPLDFLSTVVVAQPDQGKTVRVPAATGPRGPEGPRGPAGADSTVAGPRGPAGADSTVPGPKGADSTVPGPRGPAGADSTVPGPEGPRGPAGADSTVPGPRGPAGADSTVAGPRGPAGADSTVPGPEGPRGPAGGDGARGRSVRDVAPAGWYLPVRGMLSLGSAAPTLNIMKLNRYDLGDDAATFDYASVWQTGAMTIGSGANVLLKWALFDTLPDLSLPDFTKLIASGQVTPEAGTGERQLPFAAAVTRSLTSLWFGTIYTYTAAPGTAPTYLAIGNALAYPIPSLSATASVARSVSRQGVTAFPTVNGGGFGIDNNNTGPHGWLHRVAA